MFQNERNSQEAPKVFASEERSSLEDRELLFAVVGAVEKAGQDLQEAFTRDARVGGLDELLSRIHENEQRSAPVLRQLLGRLRPHARWDEDEFAGGSLPSGEWWVTDPVEGNVNFIHGMTDWCTSATLVRNGGAILTAVYDPLAKTTYTALLGRGAYQDGVRLQTSSKNEMKSALVATGQAKPGEDEATQRRMIETTAIMLKAALVLHVSVPATQQLVQVAAGRMDVFWQASEVRSGLLAGGLMVAEAGGMVTDMQGAPWSLESPDYLATAPGLHGAAVRAFTRSNYTSH